MSIRDKQNSQPQKPRGLRFNLTSHHHLLPFTSLSPMQILQESQGATQKDVNNIEVNGYNNIVSVGSDTRRGIERLLNYVQREAIHDSSARGDLGCHPGTRKEYIREITSWGKGQWESEKRAFVMTGPAGAGKSAIARDCAHKLNESQNLGASFFFYRPSLWNDPMKFIPTIVYQLTTRNSAYRDYIDAIILDNPLVLEKEMRIQFLELLVKPLFRPSVDDHNVERNLVIVVDGLDECATVAAQRQIIELITTSIHERTTPFSWAFFSRPEPPITSAFSSEIATNISWTLPLTLSGNANSDIEAYLRGSFNVIRAKHNIPPKITWPEEKDIRCLVSQSAGLFVYAVTAIRYIDGLSNGRAGFEERLHAVLQVDAPSAENPFSALDQLYTLLVMQIPEGVLYDTLSLLHLDQYPAYQRYSRATSVNNSPLFTYRLALGLSSAAFHATISNLYSVLQVTRSQDEEPKAFQFYHRSFLDFLLDQRRSRLYFIHSKTVRHHCLQKIICNLGHVSNARPLPRWGSYNFALQAFFTIVEDHVGKLEQSTLQQISQVVWKSFSGDLYGTDLPKFITKIPREWRSRIIRLSPFRRVVDSVSDETGFFWRCCAGAYLIQGQTLAILMPGRFSGVSYLLGNGDKAVYIEKESWGKSWTVDYRLYR